MNPCRARCRALTRHSDPGVESLAFVTLDRQILVHALAVCCRAGFGDRPPDTFWRAGHVDVADAEM